MFLSDLVKAVPGEPTNLIFQPEDRPGRETAGLVDQTGSAAPLKTNEAALRSSCDMRDLSILRPGLFVAIRRTQ
jgi:hypothetical protein